MTLIERLITEDWYLLVYLYSISIIVGTSDLTKSPHELSLAKGGETDLYDFLNSVVLISLSSFVSQPRQAVRLGLVSGE